MFSLSSSLKSSLDLGATSNMAKAFDKGKLKPNGAAQTLCDYIRLIKVWFDDQKVKKSKADRKLKNWQKGWIAITIENIPENSTLKYYKTEEQWLTSSKSKNIICEPLNDMIFLRKIHLPGRPYILALVFSSHSLWLSLKSYTSLTMWMEKLSHITKRYLVQLVKSTNEAIKPATYLLQVHSDKIHGYRTAHNDLEDVAWSWDISAFYAYRVHKRFITEVEIIIGSDSDLDGQFHFIGPDLECLCKRIVDSATSQESIEPCQKDTSLQDVMIATGRHLSVDSNPCYMAPSRSPSPFYSGSESDDVYVNDGDVADLTLLKKVVPLSKENEYTESSSSYLEHVYESMDREDDEYFDDDIYT